MGSLGSWGYTLEGLIQPGEGQLLQEEPEVEGPPLREEAGSNQAGSHIQEVGLVQLEGLGSGSRVQERNHLLGEAGSSPVVGSLL